MSKNTVTIVGAGLVGSLLSIFLAKRGFQVEVLERRPDARIDSSERGRSINLAISARGLHALDMIGLKEKALAQSIRMPGRMVHLKDTSTHFYPYGIYPHEAINSISRAGLNEMLLTEAERTGKVTIRFNSKVTRYNPASSELQITDTISGKQEIKTCTPVIGTDGSASAIREGIAKEYSLTVSDAPLNYGYKELVIPPAMNATSPYRIDPNALHIWPRAMYMLIALPNTDGSFTVTLFLPFKGEKSFENLSTPELIHKFFSEEFPDACTLMPTLLEDFQRNPTGHMSTIKTPKWHSSGSCMILGDAAHGIVPFFGQGMNAGFEDISTLDSVISEVGSDWKVVFEEVFNRRKINTDSIADMAEENFIEMRDKVADQRFQAERQIEKLLEKEFPGQYISRYRMVSFTRIPYAIAHQAGRIENQLLASLCEKYKTPEAVDLLEARKEIERTLVPILAPYLKEYL